MCVNCGSSSCGGCQPRIPSSAAGAAGKNAYTILASSFTMPAVGDSVTITVSSTGQFTNQWAGALQYIAITGAGYFQVTSITGLNQITIQNLGYVGNATPGVTISSGATVSPSGSQGIAGVAGLSGTDGTTRIYTVDSNQSSAVTGSYDTIDSYTLPADTLVNDGDAIVITAYMLQTVLVPGFLALPRRRLILNGSSLTILSGGEPAFTMNGTTAYLTRVEIIKTSVSTAICRVTADFDRIGGTSHFQVNKTGINFTTTNNISTQVFQYNASEVVMTSLTIDKIKAV